MEVKPIKIGNKLIGPNEPCFVVAEAGINHQGELSIAKQLVDVAVFCGVDMVKFQKRSPSKMLTKAGLEKPYTGPNSFGRTYGEHRDALELSKEDYKELKKYCDEKRILFSASPWDHESADLLEELNVPCYKIGSPDMTNLPLIEHVAKKGKPVIISTGMATMAEVEESINHLKKFTDQIVILHCTSTYPSEFKDIHLNVLKTYMQKFQYPIGYSGHERGIAVTLAARVMGACMIEKHFTLDRTMKGGDHAASLEPDGLRRVVRDIRAFEIALGNGKKVLHESEKPIRVKLAKSVVAAKHIPAGAIITNDMLTAKSPGDGLPPKYCYLLVGRKTKVSIPEDEQIKEDMLE